MTAKIIHMPESREDWLARVDDRNLACRAQGHAFPKLRAGKVGGRSVRVRRQHDGCYQITTVCRDCGMERILTTLPSGEIDLPARYRYIQPQGYKTPRGSGITKREALSELWGRTFSDLAAAAGRERVSS